MEDGVALMELEDSPEDHPQYNQTANEFGNAFRSLVPGFDLEELYNEWLASDWLCAVEQIMFDLHGVGNQEMLAEWNEERHLESRHPLAASAADRGRNRRPKPGECQ